MLLINGMENGLKYNYYAKKNSSDFKKQIYNPIIGNMMNKDLKFVHKDIHFILKKDERWNTKGEYLQISRVFECGQCHTCLVKDKCTKAKEQRKIQINYML